MPKLDPPMISGAEPEQVTDFPGQEAKSVLSNRFHVMVTPGVVRIAFGESWLGAPDVYHTPIAMLTSDAKQLAKVLTDLIEQYEKSQEQSRKEAGGG